MHDATPAGRLEARAPLSIMVIEDDEDCAHALRVFLEEHDYFVTLVGRAKTALAELRDGAMPGLIVLDLLLPEMDGWEFRVAQKLDPRCASIPLIAISADRSAKAAAIDAAAYLVKPLDHHALLRTVQSIERDLEQRRSDARGRETDRLVSLGALTGGIAHQINNPLSFVLGSIALLQKDLRELAVTSRSEWGPVLIDALRRLDHAQQGANRIADVVRCVSMFTFANTEVVSSVNVHAVLESSLQIASNEIRHCARLERSFEHGSLYVRGNPAKLGQLFLNLLLNAVYAIREARAGEHVIRVSTRQQGTNVVVSVEDSGDGMLPSARARVFSPLTSRAGGAGTDLHFGLAVGLEVVQELGGTMEVDSTFGRGSTFRVQLPLIALVSVEPQASRPPPRSGHARPSVLIVDDEPLLCALMTEMLMDAYEVTFKTSPHDAIGSILGGSFEVIVCDLMMPELSGMELFDAIVRARPELAPRFLFITGGAFTGRAHAFLQAHPHRHLAKPYTREALIEAIDAVLRAAATG